MSIMYPKHTAPNIPTSGHQAGLHHPEWHRSTSGNSSGVLANSKYGLEPTTAEANAIHLIVHFRLQQHLRPRDSPPVAQHTGKRHGDIATDVFKSAQFWIAHPLAAGMDPSYTGSSYQEERTLKVSRPTNDGSWRSSTATEAAAPATRKVLPEHLWR